MSFIPSTYQVEIDREFTQGTDNLLISAVAGSGKTTTLLGLLRKVKTSGIYLAFNKSIVEDLDKKVGYIPRVKIMTLHSMGMRGLVQHFGNLKVNENKTVNFCDKFFDKWTDEMIDKSDKSDSEKSRLKQNKRKDKNWWQLVYSIKDLYNLYRMKMCTSGRDLIEVCDILGIDYERDTIVKVLDIHILSTKYNEKPREIDFTDMIYLSATNNKIVLPNPEVTFIDECQDLNEAQHVLIDKVIRDNRFVACGDRKQSIYGFSGASSESFDRFLDKINVKELPLSVCYRCGTDIVKHANTVYNIMEPFEGNLQGSVEFEGDVLDAREGDMILCRNTAPLVKTYFEFLKEGKRAYVKGKDIGQNLINLVSKYKVAFSSQLMTELQSKLESIQKDLEKLGIENGQKHPKYVSFQEKIQIIEVFSRKYYTVAEIKSSLESMFSDDTKTGTILSTIHKAKGLESDTVYFMDSSLIPSKYAITEDQKTQEENLRYVAITRAKKRLVYCSSPS